MFFIAHWRRLINLLLLFLEDGTVLISELSFTRTVHILWF